MKKNVNKKFEKEGVFIGNALRICSEGT